MHTNLTRARNAELAALFAIPFDCNQLKSRLSNVVTLTGKSWLNAVDTRFCNCPQKKYQHHIVGIEKIEIKFGQYQRQMPKHVRFNTIWHYGQQVLTVELHACVRMRGQITYLVFIGG